jgi:hypothetical protein
VLWRAVPDYLVLATVEGYVMEATGPAGEVWRALAEWTDEAALARALSRQFGVDEATVSRDVRALLQQLHAHGLVHGAE